jgi:hypothetical protein
VTGTARPNVPAGRRLASATRLTQRRTVTRRPSRRTGVSTYRHDVLSLRVWADRVIWALIPAHHDRLAALRADLGRLAAIAEAESTTEPKEKIKIKDEAERAGQLLG